MDLVGRKLFKTTFKYCISKVNNIYVCIKDMRKIFSEKKIRIVHKKDLENIITVAWDNNFYDICEEYDFSNHRKGDGGESEEKLILKTNPEEIALLASIKFQPYKTSSNDREDIEIPIEMETYLLQEEPFARIVYNSIREKVLK